MTASRLLRLCFLASALLAGCRQGGEDDFRALHLASPPIGGLDPIRHGDQPSHRLQSHLYETLYTYDYEDRPYRLRPLLAEEFPQLQGGGRVARIRLRRGVLFHPDPCCRQRPLTAQDVVFSLRRLLDPAQASPAAWILSGKVSAVEAESDEVVRLTLAGALPELPHLLAMTATAVVQPQAVAYYGDQFDQRAVGTGPYRLLEYRPRQWLRLGAFRQGGRSAAAGVGEGRAGARGPLAEEVQVRLFAEAQPMWLHFLRGDLDLCPLPAEAAGAALSEEGRLRPEWEKKGMTLFRGSALDVTYLVFNWRDPRLRRDLKLRREIDQALDRRQAVRLFFGGLGEAAAGLIPPGLPGYRPFVAAGAAPALPLGAAPATLSLDIEATVQSRLFAEYLARALAPRGIALRIRQAETGAWMARLQRGDFQLAPMSWAADYPDSLNFLQLLYSKNAPPGPNLGAFADPRFDRLFERARLLPEGRQRQALIEEMLQQVAQQRPLLFLAHRQAAVLVQGWLQNYQYGDFTSALYAFLRLDLAAKRRLLPELLR